MAKGKVGGASGGSSAQKMKGNRKGKGKKGGSMKSKDEIALENSLFGSSASRALASSSSSSRSTAAAAIANAFSGDAVSSLAASIAGTGAKGSEQERGEDEEEDGDQPLFSLDNEKRGGAVGRGDDDDDDDDDDDADGGNSDDGYDDVVDDEDNEDKPAWRDDDDDNIEVDIGAVPLLRKLRKEVGEDTKLGAKELRKRLKERHAKSASSTGASLPWSARGKRHLEKQRRKRKRGREADDDEEADDDDDNDDDDDDDDKDDDDDDDEGMIQEDDGSDEKIVASTASVIGRPSKRAAGRNGNTSVRRPLPPGAIDILRLNDANAEAMAQSVIQCVGFNPNAALSGNLMFAAGLDRTLRLFDVDGRRNAKVQSVNFPDLPIRSAAWTRGGREIVLTGRRPFYYTYDVVAGKVRKVPGIQGRATREKSLETFAAATGAGGVGSSDTMCFLGNNGYVILVDERTKQWVADLKMNGSARAASFSADGTRLFTTGEDAEVYCWDLRKPSSAVCLWRHADAGSLNTTAIAVNPAVPAGAQYACGTASGVVNVYERDPRGDAAAAAADAAAAANLARGVASAGSAVDIIRRLTSGGGGGGGGGASSSSSSGPKGPSKSFGQLLTRVGALRYSPDGQILAMISKEKKDTGGLKLVHTATGTVFSNWPTARTPLGYTYCVDFSPRGGMMAVGGDKGRVLLYRLKHYDAV